MIDPKPPSFADLHGGRHKNMEMGQLPPEILKVNSGDAVSLIVKATQLVREARTINEATQKLFTAGSDPWQQCARVDDLLFDALTALGE